MSDTAKSKCSYPDCSVEFGLVESDLGLLCGLHVGMAKEIMRGEERLMQAEERVTELEAENAGLRRRVMELEAQLEKTTREANRLDELQSDYALRLATETAKRIGLQSELDRVKEKYAELNGLVNTPHTDNFLDAVRLEAAYQRSTREEDDRKKTPEEWFWTLGYLAGKVIRPGQTKEKELHHIVTSAALCMNWHRHASGEAKKDSGESERPR
jgi:DNA repair exonuclease SbcCD ATPase subunit